MEVKIGLEIHGYLNCKEKLFCSCKINRDAEPNSTVCPICTAQPGSKPMLPSSEAMQKVIQTALILNCQVQKRLLFQRKHYDWPDLPAGYQKTMSGAYSVPTAINGEYLGIGIEELHIEEDPAKWDPITGQVDYNRSGYPLVEIVTKPDFTSSEQAAEWLKKLIIALDYVKAIDKAAGIKCDVNVSIGPDFTRTEVKNVNSISSIKNSIEYEIKRQQKEEKIMQTRAWDAKNNLTKFMRKKETAGDYMFIPEPDIPIINIKNEYITSLKKLVPESPEIKLKKYQKLGVSQDAAKYISERIVLANLFEKTIKKKDTIITTANLFKRNIPAALHKAGLDEQDINIPEKQIIDWVESVVNKKITGTVPDDLLYELITKPSKKELEEIIKSKGLESISDKDLLNKFVDEAIKEKSNAVQDYLNGKEMAINSVVGYVMGKTKGKADPEKVKKLIKERIK